MQLGRDTGMSERRDLYEKQSLVNSDDNFGLTPAPVNLEYGKGRFMQSWGNVGPGQESLEGISKVSIL
ncbi:hypothetical protein CDV36_012571 [Fusarium kuroshium]|uniref:Uncharacterized protein n=1 Tax=Fusarium kuroshium TaxID=2010991 RepID=A0A3M2RRB9_9HYPO|nr:hypothetical protein CDV36_012571 [Fusarium kuroshium]